MLEPALIGQGLAVLSALSFAGSNILVSQASKAGESVDSGVAFSVVATTVLALAAWLVLEGGELPAAGPGNLQLGMIWFALAGVAALVLGRSMIYTSIQKIGVIRASAVRRLNPFFSVILAFVVLGEAINLMGIGGMLLVGLAIMAVMVRPFFLSADRRQESEAPPMMAYAWGIGAALAYSISYLLRKVGLIEVGAPALGTLVSSLAGLACYLVLALIVPRYWRAFAGMFSFTSPKFVVAGILVSVGQLLLFAALFYERIAIVALIASLEMFFSTFLAVLVGAEKRPDRYVVISGFVATAGVILLALSAEA